MEEVDIGSGDKPRPTFISANLQLDFREELIKLLREYKPGEIDRGLRSWL
jgi:hypothetical protein